MLKYSAKIVIALFIAFVIPSCGKKTEFSASLTLEGLGTQDVIAMWINADKVEEATVMGVDHLFQMKGNADEPTMVELYRRNGIPVGCFIAVPGEKMSITIASGRITDAGKSHANQQLMDFQNQLPDSFSASEINDLVIKMVEADPNSQAALPIFTSYFTPELNPEAAHQLIQLMTRSHDAGDATAENRQLQHITTQLTRAAELTENMPPLLKMIAPGDSIVSTSLSLSPLTVTFISSTVDRSSDTLATAIEKLLPDSARLIVVRATLDTINWQQHRDMYKSKKTEHFWSPGGLEFFAPEIAVTDYPYWIVSDSSLNRIYSTATLDSITQFFIDFKSRKTEKVGKSDKE